MSAPPRPPAKITAKLRLEKKGRGGKCVTVAYELPRDARLVEELLRSLKRALGTGGTVREDGFELQGDRLARLRELLLEKGFGVKG